MAYVVIRKSESIEHALRRFKRQVQRESIMKDYKKSSIYLSPGERKRKKDHQARKRMHRYLKRQRLYEFY